MSSMRKPVASVRPLMVPASKTSPVAKPAFSMISFEPLLDLHDAAGVLGMHWKTLESKARNKEVPAFKVGKRWRFRLSSLNNWLEDGIKSNTTDQAVVTGQERP
jgi:excisionase family DNA binding protein